MSTRTKSSQLSLPYLGGKITFGVHKATGQYRKKYQGRDVYLGTDPDGVLEQWFEKTAEIDAKKPRVVNTQKLTVKDLFDAFLGIQETRRDTGELSPATYQNYLLHANLVSSFLGKDKPITELCGADFARLKAYFSEVKPQTVKGVKVKPDRGPISLETVRTYVRNTKMFFRFAVDEGYLEKLPWSKATFSMPSKKHVKKQQQRKSPKQATKAEINAVMAVSNDTWKALILLALNSGSGNSDAAMLGWRDIKNGWVQTPRNKTNEPRRFKLWPETLDAIEKLPKYPDGLLFHGRQGANFIPKGSTDSISRIFNRLTTKAEVDRENLSFYSLRHTFQNVADEHLDFPATARIMGHSGKSMSDTYRGKISDQRLEAVTEHVRQWFFGGDQ